MKTGLSSIFEHSVCRPRLIVCYIPESPQVTNINRSYGFSQNHNLETPSLHQASIMLGTMLISGIRSFLRSITRSRDFILHPRHLKVRTVTVEISTKHMLRNTNPSVLPYTHGL